MTLTPCFRVEVPILEAPYAENQSCDAKRNTNAWDKGEYAKVVSPQRLGVFVGNQAAHCGIVGDNILRLRWGMKYKPTPYALEVVLSISYPTLGTEDYLCSGLLRSPGMHGQWVRCRRRCRC